MINRIEMFRTVVNQTNLTYSQDGNTLYFPEKERCITMVWMEGDGRLHQGAIDGWQNDGETKALCMEVCGLLKTFTSRQ